MPSFAVFRVFFALGNAVVWFFVVWALSSLVSTLMPAAGGHPAVIPPATGVAWAATAGFFMPFFGIPGALAGFLEQALERRFELPPAERWGGSGQLARAWRIAFVRGLGSSVAFAVLAAACLATAGSVPQGRFCLILAAGAAALAGAHAYALASPTALGDLRRLGDPAPTAPRRYLLGRFFLPQGGGNGLINALIGFAIFPVADAGQPALMAAGEVASDSFGTALILSFFMVTTAGSLARVDGRLGYAGRYPGRVPSRARRAGLIVAVGIGAAAVTAGAMRLAGLTGVTLWPFVLWKTTVAFAVAGSLAACAARWALGETP
jgi:hypothetical protein